MRGHSYIPGAVSAVIVNWNQAEMTQHCIDSLASCDIHEIIVVENGVPGSYTTPVQTAILSENVGWGRGANIGSQLAEGEYLWHLNNDCTAHGDALSPLLDALSDESTIAAASHLLNPDGSVQFAGTEVTFDDSGVLEARNLTEASSEGLQVLSLASCLIRADAWNHLGGVDPIFWCGYEDVDFCLRARSQGMNLRYAPESIVTHIAHGSGQARWAHTQDNVRALHNRWARVLSGDAEYPLL
jgi:O-antigen biosynthesis protein